MRVGGSLFLIAVGAILTWAVNPGDTHGFNVNTAGIILMIVGAIGLLVSLAWMMSRRRTDVVHQNAMGTSRTSYTTPNDPVGPY